MSVKNNGEEPKTDGLELSFGERTAEQAVKWKNRSRTAVLKLIFSRRTYVILSLLIQFGVLFASIKWLNDYLVYVYGGFSLLGAIVALRIVNGSMNPSLKLTWLIPVLVAPVFGSMFYLYVRADIFTKGAAISLENKHRESMPYRKEDEEIRKRLAQEDLQQANLAAYLRDHGDFPVYDETQAVYFPLGENKWIRLLEEIKKAKQFIFLEYFIINEGVMWDTVLELLAEKAEEGVEVRVMYDGTCAITSLPFSYPKKLEAMGIRCKMFSPVRPMLSTVQNNRDHRKILVIDGKVGFTGGVNLADEYINQRERFGHWKDTAVMLKGEAVQSLTLMFLEMWNLDEKAPENWIKYCSSQDSDKTYEKPNGYVIPYCDSPLDREMVGEFVYLDILNTAKRYVHIMTPYLILDNETITALSYAAKRGVETIIIMPHIPDKWYAYLLARTYYEELIRAGVQIYEYTPGFIHAKQFTSDDEKAVVGTINLDYRSLVHHFENGVWMYQHEVLKTVKKDVENTMEQSLNMAEHPLKNTMGQRFVRALVRVFAPML